MKLPKPKKLIVIGECTRYDCSNLMDQTQRNTQRTLVLANDLLPPAATSAERWLWSESEWVIQNGSFKCAENLWAGSVQIGSHRYTSILCASKLLWVYSASRPRYRPPTACGNQRAALVKSREMTGVPGFWSRYVVLEKVITYVCANLTAKLLSKAITYFMIWIGINFEK